MGLRQDMKHNFLKQVMFRMDFKGLFENDIETGVLGVRQTLFNSGLVNFDTRTENQMDLQIKTDLNLPEETPFASSVSMDKVYVFQSKSQDEVIEISKTFLTLTVVVDQVYNGFDKYVKILAKIIISLKSQTPFFRAFRIGLRKINMCYVDTLDTLQECFVSGAFNISETLDCMEGLMGKASNLLTILEKEPFHINYLRNLQEGTTVMDNGEQKQIFQVVLDIDVYCDSVRNIEALLENEEKVEKTLVNQNNIAFDCYVGSLTKKFIEKLTKEIFNEENIREVY